MRNESFIVYLVEVMIRIVTVCMIGQKYAILVSMLHRLL